MLRSAAMRRPIARAFAEIAIHATSPAGATKKEPVASVRLAAQTSYGLFGYSMFVSSSSDTHGSLVVTVPSDGFTE